MARRTKKDAEETRRIILESALDIFSRKGYSRTTFEDIALQINLSKGAVYWHFKTKSDLLVALIEDSCEHRNARLETVEEQIKTLAELRHCFLHSFNLLLSEPMLRKFEFFIYFQIEWSEELMEEVQTRLSELRKSPIRTYRMSIERLQENKEVNSSASAEELAILLIAAGTGLLRLALIRQIETKDVIELAGYQFDAIFNKKA